jgi:hypothetical protein
LRIQRLAKRSLMQRTNSRETPATLPWIVQKRAISARSCTIRERRRDRLHVRTYGCAGETPRSKVEAEPRHLPRIVQKRAISAGGFNRSVQRWLIGGFCGWSEGFVSSG